MRSRWKWGRLRSQLVEITEFKKAIAMEMGKVAIAICYDNLINVDKIFAYHLQYLCFHYSIQKKIKMDGKCLCGTIIVKTPDKQSVDACHCGMCRRWSGGPALGISCGSDVEIEGVDKLKVYQSSEWAERAFCGQCGTHIFYRLLHTNQYFVPVGLFQEGIEFEFTEQIFIDRKPNYYEFANQTLNLTEAEVFAKFAPTENTENS